MFTVINLTGDLIRAYFTYCFKYIGCVKVFFVLVSFFFLDKKSVGRRPTLIIGSIANVAIFCILGGMLFCIQRDIATGLIPSAAQGYIAMVMIYLFAVS